MLESILRFSIRSRGLILLLSLAGAVAGGWALMRLPIDAVPDITNNQVQINTAVEALTPIDVERQVTFPIETAMAGIAGLDYTRSLSRSGFSQVTVVFDDAVDIYWARQQVSERLVEARGNMPAGADPRLGPVATGLGEVYMYTVSFAHPEGSGATPAAEDEPGWQADGAYLTPEGQRLASPEDRAAYLRTVQEWIIVPQVRSVPAVAGVDSIGGFRKQYVIEPDMARLQSYGLSTRDLVDALERGNQSIGALPIEVNGEGYVVRSDGRVEGVDDLGAIPLVARGGTPIRVRDVAAIGIGREVRTGAASIDGQESVVGTALMLLGGNSRTVAKAVHERIQALASALPPDVVALSVYDRTKLVEATIRTVRNNLAEGAALVVAVLFVLLGNLRGAFIAAAVIPMSMLLAAIGMKHLGISGNLMSLGAIDFGIIVDTAVIIVENCLRRLGSRQHELGRVLTLDERLEEVAAAARQMLRPAVFGHAIITIVYLPILTLQGIEGKMFHPMALTVILALVGAFILSLTVVPALVAMLVRGRVAESENAAIRWAKAGYAPVLRGSLRWRWIVTPAAVVLFLISLLIFARLGQEFVPKLDEGDIAMQSVRIASTGMETSEAMQLAVEKALKTVPEISHVFSKTGTAEAAFDPMPVNVSDAFLMLKPRPEWPDPTLTKDGLLAKVRAAADRVPGSRYVYTQPIELRFNELIAGVRGDLAVKVFGDSFADLLTTAATVEAALTAVRGSADVRSEQVEGLPSLTLTVDREACARLGLNVADVQEVIATALGGREAGSVFEQDRRFEIVVRLPDAVRSDLDSLRRLPIPLPVMEDPDALTVASRGDLRHLAIRNRTVPLSAVAMVDVGEGLNQVSRENGKRRVVVQANVRGRDLGSFVEEARAKIAAGVTLPPGTWIAWGGQYEHLIAAHQRLSVVVPVCLLLIGMLLYSAFGSFAHALLVFTGVPLALTGGIVSLWLRGMPFSISAAVGFIALSGVAVLNGLVLLSCINQLRAEGRPLEDAIQEGCLTRLRPVLMTALVASLGFVPMALATGQGAEVQKPLATVVIGGIISSTLLTLVVLPALYRLFHRKDLAPASSVA
jgi:heavy metal efflux system protein